VPHGARHQFIAPYTRHNGKVERYHRILAEEFLYARTWTSETQRAQARKIWNIHFNYHRPHSAAAGQPPASRLATGVTILTSLPHTSKACRTILLSVRRRPSRASSVQAAGAV
jgi:transposase InsO family protein